MSKQLTEEEMSKVIKDLFTMPDKEIRILLSAQLQAIIDDAKPDTQKG